MKILISGARGLVGGALCKALQIEGGNEILALSRTSSVTSGVVPIVWDPLGGIQDLDRLSDIEAVVHLAGESVMGLWTDKKRKAIRDSRIQGTRVLMDSLKKLKILPKVVVAASAIGFYGDGGDSILNEDSPKGKGFLSDVAQEWEAESRALESLGVRTVIVRIGIVLSSRGGALSLMKTPFSLGLGGVIGDGLQYMSWVTLTDLVRIFQFSLKNESVYGIINGVSPSPCTNREFSQTLAKIYNRPAFLPIPSFILKLIFGEMADNLFLASTNVIPSKLNTLDFNFLYKKLDEAFKHELELNN